MRAITSRATHLWTLAVCAIAALAVAFICIPTARAVEASADTFAITVGGVEFNIPSDWHEMPLDDDELGELDDLFGDLGLDIDLYDDEDLDLYGDEDLDLSDEDLDESELTDEDLDFISSLFGDDDSDWLSELLGDDSFVIEYVGEEEEVLYTHNDGFLYVYAEPDPDFAATTLEDLQASADEVQATLDDYADMIDLQMQVSAELEQGYPTAIMYTDNMVLNGVTYGATIKLYAVDTEDFVGSVTSILVMPTSGVVTENFGQSFPVVETDTDVTVGSMTVTVPAGCSLADASAFGYDAVIAYDGDGGYMIALNIPGLSLGLTADNMTSLVMLFNMFIDPDELAIILSAYTFNGDGALAIDMVMDMSAIGDSEEEYIGGFVVFSEDSMEILGFYEPFGSGFSDSILEPLIQSETLAVIDTSAMTDALSALSGISSADADDEDADIMIDEIDLLDIDLDDIDLDDIDLSDIDLSDIDLSDIDLSDIYVFGGLDEETAEADTNVGHVA